MLAPLADPEKEDSYALGILSDTKVAYIDPFDTGSQKYFNENLLEF